MKFLLAALLLSGCAGTRKFMEGMARYSTDHEPMVRYYTVIKTVDGKTTVESYSVLGPQK